MHFFLFDRFIHVSHLNAVFHVPVRCPRNVGFMHVENCRFRFMPKQCIQIHKLRFETCSNRSGSSLDCQRINPILILQICSVRLFFFLQRFSVNLYKDVQRWCSCMIFFFVLFSLLSLYATSFYASITAAWSKYQSVPLQEPRVA